jgi:hypothetical protein
VKKLEWKKYHSYKLLSVMDHAGQYIYSHVCLGKNDQEVFTSSPLHLQEGDYFSMDELWHLMEHLRVTVISNAVARTQSIMM